MNIKNKKGFTIVELMTAIGILGALSVVVMYAQKSSINSTADLKTTSEVSNLIQTLTSELSRAETCTANFVTPPGPYTITRASIPAIYNKSGKPIISRMSTYGDEISINEISSAPGADVSSTAGNFGTRMLLTVKYTTKIRDADNPAPNPITIKSFAIPLNVFTVDGTRNPGSIIKSCFSDVRAMLEMAVKNACDTANSVYTAGIGGALGTCNSDFRVKNSAGGNIAAAANNYLCPAGEFLQKVTLAGASPTWTFQCVSANTANCPPWQYLTGFNTTTGAPICADLRNLTGWSAGTGIMVMQGGAYKLINITCPANQVLQGIAADGSANCWDPRQSMPCGTNQFLINIDYATRTKVCGESITPAACGGGSFVTDINGDGSVSCKSGTFTNCTNAQYISGTDGTPNTVCTTMP
ncbi:MAG: type II secretion system protein [Bacteriovorax sp.]|jgi:prepilin-type N-terminal cleavage/methylation domain-containing protein